MNRNDRQNLTSAMHRTESEIELFFKSDSIPMNELKTALMVKDKQGNELAVKAINSNEKKGAFS